MEIHGWELSTEALRQCQGSGLCPTMGHLRKELEASSKDSTRFDYVIISTRYFTQYNCFTVTFYMMYNCDI